MRVSFDVPTFGIPEFFRRLKSEQENDSAPRALKEHPVSIEQMHRIDLRLPADAELEERLRTVREALEMLQGADSITQPIGLVLPPGQTILRHTRIPPVKSKRIPDVVNYEADHQIPFDLEEVEWRWLIEEMADSPDYEICIAACKSHLVRRQLAHAASAGFRSADLIQSSEIAFADYLWNCHLASTDSKAQEEGDKPEGVRPFVVGVCMGSSNTNLVFTNGQTWWARVIKFGGNQLTQSLAAGLSITPKEAEASKLAIESPEDSRIEHLRPEYLTFLSEIQRSIGFFSSTHRNVTIDGVALAGGGLQVPGLRDYLLTGLGLEEIRIPFAHGARIGLGVSEEQAKFSRRGMIDAFTVATQRLGIGKLRMNLHPKYPYTYGPTSTDSAWGIAIGDQTLTAVRVSRERALNGEISVEELL